MGMGEGSNIFLGDQRHFGGTKDILGGATSRGTVKRSDVEMDVIFEVWAFCGRGTKTDFKDRSLKSDCSDYGWRTKDILRGPNKGPKKRSERSKFTQFFCFLFSTVGGQKPISRTGRTGSHLIFFLESLFQHQKTKRRLKAYRIK